jgi:hypothetical protein
MLCPPSNRRLVPGTDMALIRSACRCWLVWLDRRFSAGLSQRVLSLPTLTRSRLCEDVSGLAAPIAKEEFNGKGADLLYLFDWSDTTVRRIHFEIYDNRTSNCTRSSKYVSICRRHIELQYSSRSPRRQRRHGPRSYANQASEHLLQEFTCAHYA